MTSAPRWVTASAPAKTNLLLHVGSPTPDGYHPLETLFVAVDLRETVTATLDPASAGAAVSVTVEPAPGSEYARMVEQGAARLSDIPLDGQNLAVRAALAVCDAVGVPVPGLTLHVRKAVPVAGGMGGGSADAAAALVAVNELLAEHLGTAPLTPGELSRLGAGLGADVPFLLLGGAPLAMAYKAVNTLDSMVGYKHEKYRAIGMVSARLDDVANFLPARLSWLLLSLAAVLCREDGARALRTGWRDRYQHSSPNCAWPEATVAGALGIRLGGPNDYFGQRVEKPWIGDAVRDIAVDDISRTIRLMWVASSLALALFIGVRYWLVGAA